MQAVDRLDRIRTVVGLTDDLDPADLPEQEPEFFAGQLLVVDQHRAEVVHAGMRSGSVRSGISTLTDVPRPVTLDSFSVQAAP